MNPSLPRPLGKRIIRSAFAVFFLISAAALPARTLRVAVLADTHVGAGKASADLEKAVAAVNGLPGVDLVVVAGDVTEKGRDGEFAEAKRLLAGLRAPHRVLPGNHDAHWIGQDLVGFREAWPEDRFFLEIEGRFLIGLDTWDFGHLAPDDLDWLAARVKETPAAARLIVFGHAPPSGVDNWSKAHSILRARRTVYVAGHVHRTAVLDASGIPVVTVRRSMGTAEVAPGCVLLDDAEGRIAVTEISVGSEPVAAGNVDLAAWTPPPLVPEPETVPPAVEVLGRRDLGRRISIPPASGEGLVVIVDHAGKVRAFDSQAAERWAFDTGALCASRPAVDGPVVFAATARGGLVKLAAADGRLLVSRELGERVTSQLAVFRDASGRSRLLAGTVSGRLICLDGETLETVWMNAEAKDVIPGRPLVAGGRVVFGSWDARLRAVDASTGRSLWAWIGTDNFYYAPACAAPVSDGRSVFICAPDGFVSAVTLETGRIIWREKYSAWESLTLSSDGTGVLVKSRLGELHVLEAASGRLLRTAGPARGPADTMPIEPVEWGGRILYGAIDGRVYEVDGAGRSRAVLDLGKAGVHSLAPLGGGRFAAVSLDGTVVTFAK